MPELWIRNDIYDRHQEYLALHGGHRPNNPASEHHQITIARVAEWQDAWNVLDIGLTNSDATRPVVQSRFRGPRLSRRGL
jgi:hypothetical protein